MLVGCFTRPFLLAIPPRLGTTLFHVAQPVLVNQVIALVSRETHEAEQSPRQGYKIVCAAITIYVGLAVSLMPAPERPIPRHSGTERLNPIPRSRRLSPETHRISSGS